MLIEKCVQHSSATPTPTSMLFAGPKESDSMNLLSIQFMTQVARGISFSCDQLLGLEQ